MQSSSSPWPFIFLNFSIRFNMVSEPRNFKGFYSNGSLSFLHWQFWHTLIFQQGLLGHTSSVCIFPGHFFSLHHMRQHFSAVYFLRREYSACNFLRWSLLKEEADVDLQESALLTTWWSVNFIASRSFYQDFSCQCHRGILSLSRIDQLDPKIGARTPSLSLHAIYLPCALEERASVSRIRGEDLPHFPLMQIQGESQRSTPCNFKRAWFFPGI